MKDKILVFIIGLLVGAIITASGFLIYQNANKNINQTTSGEQMQMMERHDGNNAPPEMPNGETPPEKPSDSENETENSKSKTKHKSKNSTSTNSNAI